jgi:hypothetical protein
MIGRYLRIDEIRSKAIAFSRKALVLLCEAGNESKHLKELICLVLVHKPRKTTRKIRAKRALFKSPPFAIQSNALIELFIMREH